MLKSLILFEDFLNLARQSVQTVNDLVSAFSERDAILGELKSHHYQGDVL
jgi:hypothetical protein